MITQNLPRGLDAVRGCLERISRHNRDLNAYISVEAKDAESAWKPVES